MANTDYSKLSIAELNAIIEEATAARDSLLDTRRQELMRELAELDSLTGKRDKGSEPTRQRAAAKPKYRSKANTELTWVGRGGTPRWLKAEMEETGEPLESFLIK